MLLALSRYDEALLELDGVSEPDALVLLRRGLALAALMRCAEARESIARAMASDTQAVERFICRLAPGSDPEVVLAPENVFLWRRHVAQGVCNWNGWGAYVSEFRRALRTPEVPLDRALAFTALHLPLDEGERQMVASGVAAKIERNVSPLPARNAATHERIRIGILSPDLREHLNAYLLLPLFELIDRRRFEIIAYSLAPDDGSEVRGRVRAAADRLRDLSRPSDRGAALQICRDGVDLLLDCAGHTTGSRFEITAHRPAPVQVLYLAFPSTLGSSRVDYAIVDRIVVPPSSEQHWSEALVYLPDTYYLYDYRQPLPSETFARADYGLTAEGVVFCACHKPEKITPDEFDLWLRVLSQVPGAALWLNAMPAAGAENLRREAAAHGTDPRRLVFAPFDPRDRYLARQRLGDLLLDAVHHSAMTTACDALAAGLPVLTLKGASLASRAGESLLRAAGMPELVAADADAFVRAAAALGNDPATLGGLKAKLRANRASAPLFDTTARVRQLEAAFAEMHRRHRAGVAPASFGL